jgi:hypothetical protein
MKTRNRIFITAILLGSASIFTGDVRLMSVGLLVTLPALLWLE